VTPGQVPSDAAAAAIAVARGAHTVRDVMHACGMVSPSTALYALRAARTEGLVDWTDGTSATIHARLTVVTDWRRP
jgi:hypothetical protein